VPWIEYRGADKFLARPNSRCILFDGENISFDASLVVCVCVDIYIYSTNIPPIMIINRIYEDSFTNKCTFYLTHKILNIKICIKTHLYRHSYMIRLQVTGCCVRACTHTTTCNFSQAQYRPPDDGLHGPNHVGVTVKKCFNANFNV
jgi:hypothetical protein